MADLASLSTTTHEERRLRKTEWGRLTVLGKGRVVIQGKLRKGMSRRQQNIHLCSDGKGRSGGGRRVVLLLRRCMIDVDGE